jgi:hypothetical protein
LEDHQNADLRRKTMIAITAKLACVAHAVIENGSLYRFFFEGRVPAPSESAFLFVEF